MAGLSMQILCSLCQSKPGRQHQMLVVRDQASKILKCNSGTYKTRGRLSMLSNTKQANITGVLMQETC